MPDPSVRSVRMRSRVPRPPGTLLNGGKVGSGGSRQPPQPARSDAEPSAQAPRHVGLVGEAALERDLGERARGVGDEARRAPRPQPAPVLARARSEVTAERLREMDRMNIDVSRDDANGALGASQLLPN